MTGLERIINAFKSQAVDRIPWVPFVGVHGGFLIGNNADEYLQSSENLVNGINKAIETYQPDGIPVCFDLQIEAEALGCKLVWSADNPPAVVSHPLAGGKSLENLPEFKKTDGRITLVLEAAAKMRAEHPDLALYNNRPIHPCTSFVRYRYIHDDVREPRIHQ